MSKNGFSFYRAETDRFQDIKVKRLKKKYGCDGYAVYQYALNEIYRVEGSYIRWTEDQMFDCSDYWDMEEARVEEIINYCAEICLFDPVIWKGQCILTARSIQSRYLDICKLSKKKVYIPMGIILVETQQEMKQPEAMPLFEGGIGVADNSPKPEQEVFRNTLENSQNILESSGNLPEKNDKEEQSRAKQNKENPSSIPPELSREEAKKLCSAALCPELAMSANAPQTTGISSGGGGAGEKPRNPSLLIAALKAFNLSPRELEEVLQLSRHGEQGNPVWGIINEIKTSPRIKMPRLFLLSRLRNSVGKIDVKKAAAS